MIEDILRNAGVSYKRGGEHRHVRPGWVGVDCPRCGPNSGKYHLGINTRLGRAVCWKCGRWDLAEALSAVAHLQMSEAIRIAKAIRHGRAASEDKPIRRARVKVPKDVGPLREPHKRYLRKRRFDPDKLVDTWRIQGAGPWSDRIPWRIFIPIYLDERMVSWTSRSIVDGVPSKYVSAKSDEEEVKHKHILYGEDYTWHSVIVVEGPLDAWRIGPGAVALFGIPFTSAQIARLARYARRAIVLDREKEAQRHAKRLANALSPFPGETVVVQLETGDDPAEADEEELEELRRLFIG